MTEKSGSPGAIEWLGQGVDRAGFRLIRTIETIAESEEPRGVVSIHLRRQWKPAGENNEVTIR